MALTPAQLATLKADILADPVLNAYPINPDGAIEVAKAYNALAVPDYIVWRGRVMTDEIGKAVSYVAVESMTTANRDRIITFYTLSPNGFSPSADIRTFWANTFSGALGGAGQATRDALEALWRRKASRIEKLFASGLGTTASPSTLSFEGSVTYPEILQARELP